MNEGIYFRQTMDELDGHPAAIEVLMNLADGLPFLGDPWTYRMLVNLDLVIDLQNVIAMGDWSMLLTNYGAQFVGWYRQPRELPTQLDMFGGVL